MIEAINVRRGDRLANKIYKFSDRNEKLQKLVVKYLKNEEAGYKIHLKHVFKGTYFFTVGNHESLQENFWLRKLFEIILSVPNSEMTHFIETISTSFFNDFSATKVRGYQRLLLALHSMDEKSKEEFLYYLVYAKIDHEARADFVDALAKNSGEKFKSWMLSTLVAHAEDSKEANKFFEELLSRKIFDEKLIEKFVGDSVVGKLCEEAVSKQEKSADKVEKEVKKPEKEEKAEKVVLPNRKLDDRTK